MGHNSDSDVMGTRVGGMLLTQVRSPPHWLTLKGTPNPKPGSADAGRNLAKNAKSQKTSFFAALESQAKDSIRLVFQN